MRKDKKTPYVSHPMRVALTITCVFGFAEDDELLAAALLHDTIEDTNIDREDIVEACGESVAEYVARMTKDMRLPELEREIAYDRQLAEGPWQARLLKLADVYDNISDPYKGGERSKMLEKARRAVALAAHDARLAKARAIVQQAAEALASQP